MRHAGQVAQVDDDIENAGAAIIWVLEENAVSRPGTAQDCLDWMRGRGANRGLCVGDAQTEPVMGVFDRSPFAKGRGFDIIVRRSSMTIEYVTSHGTPSGNENLDGQAVLDAVRAHTGR